MTAVGYALPIDRMSDWLEELEQILKGFDALPSRAQDAVNSVVESLLHDPDTSDAETAPLSALLARHKPPSDDGLHQGRVSLSQKRTQFAHRIALALSQSS